MMQMKHKSEQLKPSKPKKSSALKGKRAFAKKALNDTTSMEFHFLMEQLQNGKNDIRKQLIHTLRKLSSNFPSKVAEIASYIRGFVLLGPDSELTKEFLKFCKNIVTGNNYYLIPVVKMAISNIVPRSSQFHFMGDHEEDYDQEATDKIIAQVTKFLRSVLQLVPLSIGIIGKHLSKGFPHHARPAYYLEMYMKVLLKCCGMMPGLKMMILPSIINDIAKMDAAIMQENKSNETEESVGSTDSNSVQSDTLTSMMFTMELGDEDGREDVIAKKNKILSKKIDLLMKMIYLDVEMRSNSNDSTFDLLINTFEKIVLKSFNFSIDESVDDRMS